MTASLSPHVPGGQREAGARFAEKAIADPAVGSLAAIIYAFNQPSAFRDGFVDNLASVAAQFVHRALASP